MEAGIARVPVNLIDRDPSQPRRDFDEEGLEELAKSIADNGLLQPIALRLNGDKRYKIIAGERRFRAVSRILKWKDIPAIVHDVDDASFRKMQLLENMVRKDLNSVEVAKAMKQMLDHSMTAEDIGKSVGKDGSYVQWLTQILKCTDQALHLIEKGQLTAWVGWHLSRLSFNGQVRALRTFRLNKYTPREMVAVCENIYAIEHQVPMFTQVELTGLDAKLAASFMETFTRLFRLFDRLQVLESKKPGSVACMVKADAKVARLQVKELASDLRWLDKILLKREMMDSGK